MNYDKTPVNKNATKSAKELLEYLVDTAGNAIITGQHTQTIPMEEYNLIHDLTGYYPKLVGFELLSYSPNINYDDADEECLTEIYENRNTLEKAMEIAETTDSILCFCFHWFSPIGGRDKAFYSKNTDFDARKVLVEGSPERQAFYSDLRVIAELLMPFKEKDIPILWRPFHEVEGTWFWWGAQGGEVAKELYKLQYDLFVNEFHLDNLLWVWSSPTRESYPGDEYVDVIGWDIYLPEKKPTDYADYYSKLTDYTAPHKVHALTEIGYLPNVEMLEQSHTPWAYFMTWSKEFIIGEQYNSVDELNAVYHSDYVVTL
jgi:mannan endo-1,4-beta-mannosidase